MTDNGGDPIDSKATRVEYHHIKSNSFRVIHVDGGVGGVTPRGFFHIALYNERPAIPRIRARDVLSETELGPERDVDVRGQPNVGIVREVEADLIFDMQTAVELRDWLDRNIKSMDEFQHMQNKKSEEHKR